MRLLYSSMVCKCSLAMVTGGMTQALGYGHCEEMVYDERGRMLNARFGPYKIYRADEMPRIEAYLVQTMEKSGPFGAKAIAEIPKDGVVPAIRNAILNATGVATNQSAATGRTSSGARINPSCARTAAWYPLPVPISRTRSVG